MAGSRCGGQGRRRDPKRVATVGVSMPELPTDTAFTATRHDPQADGSFRNKLEMGSELEEDMSNRARVWRA